MKNNGKDTNQKCIKNVNKKYNGLAIRTTNIKGIRKYKIIRVVILSFKKCIKSLIIKI